MKPTLTDDQIQAECDKIETLLNFIDDPDRGLPYRAVFAALAVKPHSLLELVNAVSQRPRALLPTDGSLMIITNAVASLIIYGVVEQNVEARSYYAKINYAKLDAAIAWSKAVKAQELALEELMRLNRGDPALASVADPVALQYLMSKEKGE